MWVNPWWCEMCECNGSHSIAPSLSLFLSPSHSLDPSLSHGYLHNDDAEDRTLTSRHCEGITQDEQWEKTATAMNRNTKSGIHSHTASEKLASYEYFTLGYTSMCGCVCVCMSTLFARNSAFVNSHYGENHALHIDTHIAICIVPSSPKRRHQFFATSAQNNVDSLSVCRKTAWKQKEKLCVHV